MRQILMVLALTILLAAALAFALGPAPALAQESTGVTEINANEHPGFLAAKGRVTFRRYCASCHGEKADGNGTVAAMLTVQPPDLRVLARDNEGTYPADAIAATIDGRDEVQAHGRRDMPVWGEVFQTPLVESEPRSEEDREARARLKIKELVLFLETIQIDEPADGEAQD